MKGKQQQDFRVEKYIRYGIRKYSFGAASVAIAAGLMFLGNGAVSATEVQSAETTISTPTPSQDDKDKEKAEPKAETVETAKPETTKAAEVKPEVKAEEAKKIEGVSEVQDGGANTERLFKLASFIRVWGLVIAGLLIFIAVFLISNTIRITIISRSREIQIMRLVGAKNGYIRGPFLLEGAFIGLLGATLPSVLVFIVYKMVYQSVNKSLVGQNLSMISPEVFSPLMIALLFVIGIFIGSIGSGISMRRFLKI